MTKRVLGRLGIAVLLLWLVATTTFFVVQLAPGSFADTMDTPRLSPEAREQLRARYGADQPVITQYWRWLSRLAQGDLGTSFRYRMPVRNVLGNALPPTLLLTGSALVLDLVLGLILALAAVKRPFGWFDRITSMLALFVYGLPSFFLAGLAVLIFAVSLGWFPASHMHSVGAADSGPAALVDLLHHLVLPVLCLGIVGAAGTARYLRASLLDLRQATFVLACHARGLPRWRVLWIHTLRPALLPVVTLLGLSIPVLFSGSVVIEVVFSWPGMGRVLWDAAIARDVPVIMAATLLGAAGVILGNLVADLLYSVLDPRAREQR